MGGSVAREIAEFEKVAKARSNRLHELYRRARDKERAGRVLDLLEEGRISYEEAVRELRRLARR